MASCTTKCTNEPQLGAATGSDGTATEHTEEPQLAELLSQEAGLTSQIQLQVRRSQLIDYSYTWAGSQVSTQKLQVVLQSKIPDQYCLGIAKLQKKDKAELKKLQDRWQIGTLGALSKINPAPS